MPSDYDIIIAGGGPAGLSAAKTVAESGLEVLVLELQAQIGQTQTSSWITSEVFDEEFSSTVKSDVEEVELHSVHRDLEIGGNFGKIIDREKFDKLLASKAVESGADIWVGAPVRGILEGKKGVQGVRIEAGEWSEEIESNVLVDATGARAEWSSIFLRKVQNKDWDKEKNTQTNEYLMTNSKGKEKLDLYFNSLLAPRGYAWIHPFNGESVMAGIRGVRIHPDSALDEFIGREKPDRLTESVPIGEYRGQLPVEGVLDSMVSDGILAIGTAAGQIYPLSAHGLKYALESGKIAGEVIAESVQENNFSAEKLSDYEREWRNRFEKEIKTGELLLDSLEVSPDQKMDSLLDLLDEKNDLQESFVNIFLAKDLKESLKAFFKGEEIKRIFGKKRVDKILSLYS